MLVGEFACAVAQRPTTPAPPRAPAPERLRTQTALPRARRQAQPPHRHRPSPSSHQSETKSQTGAARGSGVPAAWSGGGRSRLDVPLSVLVAGSAKLRWPPRAPAPHGCLAVHLDYRLYRTVSKQPVPSRCNVCDKSRERRTCTLKKSALEGQAWRKSLAADSCY